MKSIEVLTSEISELTSKLVETKVRLRDIEASRNQELGKVVERQFAPCLTNGVTISGACTTSVKFSQPDPGYINGKEVLSLYFRCLDWESSKINKVETSFYSTNESSEFELKRMVLIGKVGRVLLNSTQGFINEFNQVIEKFEGEEYKSVLRESFELDKDIVSKKKELLASQQDHLFEQACDKGIRIECERLPSFAVKHDLSFHRVNGIRIVRMTTSGKSADVEISFQVKTYHASDIIEERKSVITGVRRDKILSFLRRNKHIIAV